MSILPPNATALETALEEAFKSILAFDVPVGRLWSAEAIPAGLLGYLAWALSVDEWDPDWSEGRKREVIAASVEIHRRKGTPWAIRRALATVGLGSATLIEQYGAKSYDGTVLHDGAETYSPQDHWAEYRVLLERPITIAQADKVRAVLASVAPARCHLKALDYQQATNIYDAAIVHDGTYSHGVS